MDIPDTRKEFLYRDFDAVFRYRIAFSNMRLAALGATLALFGALISTSPASAILEIAGRLLAIELVVFAAIRILAALNRGIQVFGNHIAWIEKELGQRGFSTYWKRFLSRNSLDSGSHAFLVATRALNIGAFGYVCAGLVPTLTKIRMLGTGYGYAIGIGVPAILAVWNEVHIRRRLDPRGFANKLAESLDRARSESFPVVQRHDQHEGS